MEECRGCIFWSAATKYKDTSRLKYESYCDKRREMTLPDFWCCSWKAVNILDRPEDPEVQEYRRLCVEHNVRDFLPSKGICYRCYEKVLQGSRVKYAKTFTDKYITGCTWCNCSYCD